MDSRERIFGMKKDCFRYPCHIYDAEDVNYIRMSDQVNVIKGYGERTNLPDGNMLHKNYSDRYLADGRRYFVRCRECGGLFLMQETIDWDVPEGPDRLNTWIPVATEEEANLLNILLSAEEFENYPFRHLKELNHICSWKGEGIPHPNDPEELRDKIRQRYIEGYREMMESMIRKAGRL